MAIASLIVLLTVAAQAHGKELVDDSMDEAGNAFGSKLLDNLANRAFKVSPLRHTEVDNTTIAKPHKTRLRQLVDKLVDRLFDRLVNSAKKVQPAAPSKLRSWAAPGEFPDTAGNVAYDVESSLPVPGRGRFVLAAPKKLLAAPMQLLRNYRWVWGGMSGSWADGEDRAEGPRGLSGTGGFASSSMKGKQGIPPFLQNLDVPIDVGREPLAWTPPYLQGMEPSIPVVQSSASNEESLHGVTGMSPTVISDVPELRNFSNPNLMAKARALAGLSVRYLARFADAVRPQKTLFNSLNPWSSAEELKRNQQNETHSHLIRPEKAAPEVRTLEFVPSDIGFAIARHKTRQTNKDALEAVQKGDIPLIIPGHEAELEALAELEGYAALEAKQAAQKAEIAEEEAEVTVAALEEAAEKAQMAGQQSEVAALTAAIEVAEAAEDNFKMVHEAWLTEVAKADEGPVNASAAALTQKAERHMSTSESEVRASEFVPFEFDAEAPEFIPSDIGFAIRNAPEFIPSDVGFAIRNAPRTKQTNKDLLAKLESVDSTPAPIESELKAVNAFPPVPAAVTSRSEPEDSVPSVEQSVTSLSKPDNASPVQQQDQSKNTSNLFPYNFLEHPEFDGLPEVPSKNLLAKLESVDSTPAPSFFGQFASAGHSPNVTNMPSLPSTESELKAVNAFPPVPASVTSRSKSEDAVPSVEQSVTSLSKPDNAPPVQQQDQSKKLNELKKGAASPSKRDNAPPPPVQQVNNALTFNFMHKIRFELPAKVTGPSKRDTTVQQQVQFREPIALTRPSEPSKSAPAPQHPVQFQEPAAITEQGKPNNAPPVQPQVPLQGPVAPIASMSSVELRTPAAEAERPAKGTGPSKRVTPAQQQVQFREPTALTRPSEPSKSVPAPQHPMQFQEPAAIEQGQPHNVTPPVQPQIPVQGPVAHIVPMSSVELRTPAAEAERPAKGTGPSNRDTTPAQQQVQFREPTELTRPSEPSKSAAAPQHPMQFQEPAAIIEQGQPTNAPSPVQPQIPVQGPVAHIVPMSSVEVPTPAAEASPKMTWAQIVANNEVPKQEVAEKTVKKQDETHSHLVRPEKAPKAQGAVRGETHSHVVRPEKAPKVRGAIQKADAPLITQGQEAELETPAEAQHSVPPKMIGAQPSQSAPTPQHSVPFQKPAAVIEQRKPNNAPPVQPQVPVQGPVAPIAPMSSVEVRTPAAEAPPKMTWAQVVAQNLVPMQEELAEKIIKQQQGPAKLHAPTRMTVNAKGKQSSSQGRVTVGARLLPTLDSDLASVSMVVLAGVLVGSCVIFAMLRPRCSMSTSREGQLLSN